MIYELEDNPDTLRNAAKWLKDQGWTPRRVNKLLEGIGDPEDTPLGELPDERLSSILLAINDIRQRKSKLNGHAAPAPLPLDALMDLPPLRLVTMADAVARKRPGWRIENILRAESVYTMTGHPGQAKTTIAALLAACVSCGQPFAGQGTEPGRVLMLAADDFGGAADRAAVLDQLPAYRGSLARILVSRESFDMTGDEAMAALEALAAAHAEPQGLALISVDTILHYAPSAMESENDNVSMSRYLQLARRLTHLPGSPTVLIQCHPRKGAPNDAEHLVPRGGSAALGASDGNLAVWLDGDIAHMHHSAKMRGAFDELVFRLERQVRLEGMRDDAGLGVFAPMVSAMTIAEQDKAQRDDMQGQHAVLAYLQALPTADWRSAEEIKLDMHSRLPLRTLQRHLGALVESRQAERCGGSKNIRYRAKSSPSGGRTRK